MVHGDLAKMRNVIGKQPGYGDLVIDVARRGEFSVFVIQIMNRHNIGEKGSFKRNDRRKKSVLSINRAQLDWKDHVEEVAERNDILMKRQILIDKMSQMMKLTEIINCLDGVELEGANIMKQVHNAFTKVLDWLILNVENLVALLDISDGDWSNAYTLKTKRERGSFLLDIFVN